MEKNSIKSNVKNKIKNSKLGLGLFIVLIVLIAIIKQGLVADLPINILAHAKQDDALMVDMAKEMLNGNYLGGYNDLIFTKGIMFPLFLVIGYSLGFSYISFQTLVYTLSCAFFIYSIKDFIKSKWILLGIFVALVFNPLSFASETLMRVYRNGITMSQVLIIIGSYIGMYMNRTDKKKTLFFALFGGLGIGTMYHTREDAFWIMPFMIVVTMILIGLLIKDKKKDIIKTGKMQTFIYVIPFVMLTLVTNIISTINYNHYGIYTYNELNDSNFTKCMKAIYSVKPNVEIEYVSNPKEKIERIAEVSPTFNSIVDVMLNKNYKSFDGYDRKPGDGEIEDGWFFWVLRESVVESGVCETVNDIDEFYLKVTEEINTAIADGKLEKQATMPSSLMPPWRKGNFGKLFAALGEEIGFILNYDDVEVKIEESIIDSKYQVYEDFKNITRNNAISPIKEVQVSGWFANIDTEDIVLEVQDENGDTLHVFAMLKEDKILKEYINDRFEINHSGRVNYFAKFEAPKDSKRFFIVAKNNDEVLIKKEIENKTVNYEENNCLLEIKKLVVLDKEIEEKAEVAAEKLTGILNVYRNTGVAVFVVAMIIFVYYIVKLVYMLVKGKIDDNIDLLNTVLILLGIILTVLVLMLGVAYNHIASCNSITYMYLSGAYPIVIMFWSVSIGKGMENLYIFINKKLRKV